MGSVRRRDNYIVARKKTVSGRGVVDNDGFLVEGDETVIEFWASVKVLKTQTSELPQNALVDGVGKRFKNKTYEITCDSRDIEDLDLDFYLEIDEGTAEYQVLDIYEGEISGVDFDATVIAKQTI